MKKIVLFLMISVSLFGCEYRKEIGLSKYEPKEVCTTNATQVQVCIKRSSNQQFCEVYVTYSCK